MRAFRRAAYCLPRSAILAAYKGAVRARMEYLSPIWCGGPQTDLRLLHKVQHRAIRLIACDSMSDTALRQCQLQSLHERWKVSSLALLFRAVKGVAPLPVIDLLPETVTRNRKIVPRSRTSHHQNSFFPRTIREWNILPPDFFSCENPSKALQRFKKLASQDQAM